MKVPKSEIRENLNTRKLPGLQYYTRVFYEIVAFFFTLRCELRGVKSWARILVQVTIYRRLLIGRDGHLDQSEAYNIS